MEVQAQPVAEEGSAGVGGVGVGERGHGGGVAVGVVVVGAVGGVLEDAAHADGEVEGARGGVGEEARDGGEVALEVGVEGGGAGAARGGRGHPQARALHHEGASSVVPVAEREHDVAGGVEDGALHGAAALQGGREPPEHVADFADELGAADERGPPRRGVHGVLLERHAARVAAGHVAVQEGVGAGARAEAAALAVGAVFGGREDALDLVGGEHFAEHARHHVGVDGGALAARVHQVLDALAGHAALLGVHAGADLAGGVGDAGGNVGARAAGAGAGAGDGAGALGGERGGRAELSQGDGGGAHVGVVGSADAVDAVHEVQGGLGGAVQRQLFDQPQELALGELPGHEKSAADHGVARGPVVALGEGERPEPARGHGEHGGGVARGARRDVRGALAERGEPLRPGQRAGGVGHEKGAETVALHGHHGGVAVGAVDDAVLRPEQGVGLGARLQRLRDVEVHLVAVEVGVEPRRELQRQAEHAETGVDLLHGERQHGALAERGLAVEEHDVALAEVAVHHPPHVQPARVRVDVQVDALAVALQEPHALGVQERLHKVPVVARDGLGHRHARADPFGDPHGGGVGAVERGRDHRPCRKVHPLAAEVPAEQTFFTPQQVCGALVFRLVPVARLVLLGLAGVQVPRVRLLQPEQRGAQGDRVLAVLRPLLAQQEVALDDFRQAVGEVVFAPRGLGAVLAAADAGSQADGGHEEGAGEQRAGVRQRPADPAEQGVVVGDLAEHAEGVAGVQHLPGPVDQHLFGAVPLQGLHQGRLAFAAPLLPPLRQTKHPAPRRVRRHGVDLHLPAGAAHEPQPHRDLFQKVHVVERLPEPVVPEVAVAGPRAGGVAGGARAPGRGTEPGVAKPARHRHAVLGDAGGGDLHGGEALDLFRSAHAERHASDVARRRGQRGGQRGGRQGGRQGRQGVVDGLGGGVPERVLRGVQGIGGGRRAGRVVQGVGGRRRRRARRAGVVGALEAARRQQRGVVHHGCGERSASQIRYDLTYGLPTSSQVPQ